MTLKEYLRQVGESRLKCADLRQRIMDLNTRCQNITTKLCAAPGGGGQNGPGDQLLALLADETARLAEALDRELRATAEVEAFIDTIQTPEPGKTILKRRYLRGDSISDVQRWLTRTGCPYSRSQVYRLYAAAMRDADAAYRRRCALHTIQEGTLR